MLWSSSDKRPSTCRVHNISSVCSVLSWGEKLLWKIIWIVIFILRRSLCKVMESYHSHTQTHVSEFIQKHSKIYVHNVKHINAWIVLSPWILCPKSWFVLLFSSFVRLFLCVLCVCMKLIFSFSHPFIKGFILFLDSLCVCGFFETAQQIHTRKKSSAIV